MRTSQMFSTRPTLPLKSPVRIHCRDRQFVVWRLIICCPRTDKLCQRPAYQPDSLYANGSVGGKGRGVGGCGGRGENFWARFCNSSRPVPPRPLHCICISHSIARRLVLEVKKHRTVNPEHPLAVFRQAKRAEKYGGNLLAIHQTHRPAKVVSVY